METVSVPLTVRELKILLELTSDDTLRPKGLPRLTWVDLRYKLLDAVRRVPR